MDEYWTENPDTTGVDCSFGSLPLLPRDPVEYEETLYYGSSQPDDPLPGPSSKIIEPINTGIPSSGSQIRPTRVQVIVAPSEVDAMVDYPGTVLQLGPEFSSDNSFVCQTNPSVIVSPPHFKQTTTNESSH